jgi:hypothetical protein
MYVMFGSDTEHMYCDAIAFFYLVVGIVRLDGGQILVICSFSDLIRTFLLFCFFVHFVLVNVRLERQAPRAFPQPGR